MTNATNEAKTSVQGRELTVTRSFRAPKDLVFKAWTDPKHLAHWWGPQGFTTTTEEIDVRSGGVWRYVMHGPDGTDYVNVISFIDVTNAEKLEYSHGDGEVEELFRVTVTLEQQGDGTRLTMRSLFRSEEELKLSVEKYGALEGANQTLDRLEARLPAVTFAGAEARVFTLKRIFNAPRSLVFQAYSQPEHLKHWWGPRGWTLTVCNIDFRAGGSWHYCMKCMDESQGDYYGMESWGKAIYKEIVPNEKIVLVDYFSDAEGTESGDLPASESTWQFFDQGDQTLMVSTSTYASEEALRQVVEMGMEQGITETLDRLAERLAELR